MRTLVAGGAGFVGLNIVEHLLRAGEDVTIFDLGAVPDKAQRAFADLPGRLTCLQGDVTNPEDVARAFAPGADAVVCAAAVTAGEARDRATPELTLSVNLNGVMNLFRGAKDAGSRRVINLSSAGAYGAAAFRNDVLDEAQTVADPVSIYSLTKFASERIGDRMAEVWEMDILSVRLSAVFGRWERKTSVRDTPSPQHQILQAALSGTPARLARRDARDWIYAPDVARAVIALRDAPTLRHRLYNISTGETWSVSDWGAALAAEMPGFDCAVAGPGETANIDLFATTDRGPMNIDRLVADTGFAHRYGLQQSVADYREWALSN